MKTYFLAVAAIAALSGITADAAGQEPMRWKRPPVVCEPHCIGSRCAGVVVRPCGPHPIICDPDPRPWVHPCPDFPKPHPCVPFPFQGIK